EENLAQPIEVAPDDVVVEVPSPVLPQAVQDRLRNVATECTPRETAIVSACEEHVGGNPQHQLYERLRINGSDDLRPGCARLRLTCVEIGGTEQHAQLAGRLPRRVRQPSEPWMNRRGCLALANDLFSDEPARLVIQRSKARQRPAGDPDLQSALQRMPGRLAQNGCGLGCQPHDGRTRPMPAQVGSGGFADTKAAECAIAPVPAERGSCRLPRDQALLLSGSNQAHQRTEGLCGWRHFQNRAKPDGCRPRFDLDVL